MAGKSQPRTIASRSTNYRLANYLKLNILVAVGLTAGIGLAQIGWSPIQIIFGLVALVLPAYHLVRSIERLAMTNQGPTVRWLWAIMLSVTVTPAAVWLISRFVFGGDPLYYIWPAFLAWWGITLLATALVEWYRPAKTEVKSEPSTAGIFTVIFVAAAILGLAMLLYAFIPEADSYTYLITLRQLQANPTLLATTSRPLFLIVTQLFSVVSRLSPYWLYKLILPLGLLTTPVSLYVISQPLLKSRGWRLLAAISPLAFPVVLQEMLISRPQSIFLICFVPILFLLGRLSLNRRQPGNLYWLLASVLIGVVGLAIHTLFAFIVAAGLLSLVVFYWPNIIQRPIESLLIFLGIGVAFYPWISRAGIVGDAIEIGRLFAVTARHSHFRLWFLSHYRNADGNEVGWPGILAIFYYGYNLGLLMIGLLGILALPAFFRRRPWRGLNAGQLWPAWLSLAFFGFIAEVAPRFGFAFLPDRAWLFIALSFSLLMPYVLARLVNQPFKRKIYPIFLVSLALLSLIAGWAIGYGKSGWIVSADYPAAAFINAKLSPDAVILSQGTNHVLVRYFAQRLMVRPMTNIFLSSDPNAVQDYLDRQESDYARVRSVNLDERHRLGNELRQIDSAYPNAAASDQLILRIERAAIESEFLSLATAEKQLRLTYPTVNAPIYILYSRNKDQTLYASRSWWRSSNFFGADLAKFTVRYPIIYNQGGVTIWQVTH